MSLLLDARSIIDAVSSKNHKMSPNLIFEKKFSPHGECYRLLSLQKSTLILISITITYLLPPMLSQCLLHFHDGISHICLRYVKVIAFSFPSVSDRTTARTTQQDIVFGQWHSPFLRRFLGPVAFRRPC